MCYLRKLPDFFLLSASVLILADTAGAMDLKAMNVTIHFSIIFREFTEDCAQGLIDPGNIYLQYREIQYESSSQMSGHWKLLETIDWSSSNTGGDPYRHNKTHSLENRLNSTHFQFRLIQVEHGGGYCNCWGLLNQSLSVTMLKRSEMMILQECNYIGNRNHILKNFYITCSGSASVTRGVISTLISITNGSLLECPKGLENVIEMRGIPLQNCDNATDKIMMFFNLTRFDFSTDCKLFGADKGIEVAIRGFVDDIEQWIPIHYIPSTYDRQEAINIGQYIPCSNQDYFIIRGYQVPATIMKNKHTAKISICDQAFLTSGYLQFRWLQTARFNKSSNTKDVWQFDGFKVMKMNNSMTSVIFESANNTHNNMYLENLRNGEYLDSNVSHTECKRDSSGILFDGTYGSFQTTSNNFIITSRSVTTKNIRISFESSLQGVNNVMIFNNTVPPCSLDNTIPNAILTDTSTERFVTSLAVDFKSSIDEQLSMLANFLYDLINIMSPLTIMDVENILNSASEIIRRGSLQNSEKLVNDSSGGSLLLDAMDQFAAAFVPANMTLFTESIILISSQSSESHKVEFNTSDGMEFSINLPQELLSMFEKYEGNEDGTRAISYLFRNADTVFSETISDIVSTALLCGNEICNTSNLSLDENVTITISHSLNQKLSCVFWNFHERTNNGFRTEGYFSSTGCFMDPILSTATKSVCQCNHLTHFAILLSPNPPQFDDIQTAVLVNLGYIGVSISLVAMSITVITFVAVKSLRSMRNYIHVNLCISLAIAQVLFISGVDKTGVAQGCQAIAVLLHYFFLVSFMWMLMEGVVLYVALVRVFVKHKKRYVIAFTLTSYGLPVLYMGALTLPIGFAYPGYPYYGSTDACFLKPPFIWALIGPVIIIFLANIGFLLMAAKIMWHHQMKRKDKKRIHNFRGWVRSLITLMIVMGLTWISGIFLIIRNELIFLAYIFTVLVACQGLLIFLVFVVFSKTVREAYKKWWKLRVSESSFLSKYFGDKTFARFSSASAKSKEANHKDKMNSDVGMNTSGSKNTTENTAETFQASSSLPSSVPNQFKHPYSGMSVSSSTDNIMIENNSLNNKSNFDNQENILKHENKVSDPNVDCVIIKTKEDDGEMEYELCKLNFS